MTIVKNLIIFVSLIIKIVSSEDTVESLENVINKAVQDSLNYVVPTDARRYKPKNTTIKGKELNNIYITKHIKIPRRFWIVIAQDRPLDTGKYITADWIKQSVFLWDIQTD